MDILKLTHQFDYSTLYFIHKGRESDKKVYFFLSLKNQINLTQTNYNKYKVQ